MSILQQPRAKPLDLKFLGHYNITQVQLNLNKSFAGSESMASPPLAGPARGSAESSMLPDDGGTLAPNKNVAQIAVSISTKKASICIFVCIYM